MAWDGSEMAWAAIVISILSMVVTIFNIYLAKRTRTKGDDS